MKIVFSYLHILSSLINNTPIDWDLFSNFSSQEWKQLYDLSSKQGVAAIIFEKLKEVPKEIAPPKSGVMKWLSHTMSIEEQMRRKEAVAVDFAERMLERGIQVVVLKGLAYASHYPNPYHRESGDLDCYMLGKKDEGDKSVVEIGGMMEEAGYKHSHLYYKGLTIENHKFITSFDNTKLGIRTEKMLQELIRGELNPICNSSLLSPCADFNAIFLIKHAQRHFIKEGICTRHLLDWAFFLKAEAENVNWNKVIPLMKECRIFKFAQVMTSLCREKLEMPIEIEGLTCSCMLSDAVLADILSEQPDLFHENMVQKIGRILRRFYRMWKFRSLADESYIQLVWNSVAFSSYLKRTPKI